MLIYNLYIYTLDEITYILKTDSKLTWLSNY